LDRKLATCGAGSLPLAEINMIWQASNATNELESCNSPNKSLEICKALTFSRQCTIPFTDNFGKSCSPNFVINENLMALNTPVAILIRCGKLMPESNCTTANVESA